MTWRLSTARLAVSFPDAEIGFMSYSAQGVVVVNVSTVGNIGSRLVQVDWGELTASPGKRPARALQDLTPLRGPPGMYLRCI